MNDLMTTKERMAVANRRLQIANMLMQGETGHDGRYGDWLHVDQPSVWTQGATAVLLIAAVVCLVMLGFLIGVK